jgi:hypothetical protein
MVNKALNESLDLHIAKTKTRVVSPAKKNEGGRLSLFKRIWEYFFPSDEYEHATFSSDAMTVVHRVDKGFKRHWRQFVSLFTKKKK